MKYRSGTKIKIKHGLIDGLERFLKRIEVWPEIKSINPGVIKPTRKRKGEPFRLKVQYKTNSGLKCIAQSQGVQEVFIVADDIENLIKKITDLETGKS